MAEALAARLAPLGLIELGRLALRPDDGLGPAWRSLVLIGPDEPRFWSVFSASPEYRDGAAAPMDRWSRRVLDGLAATLSAEADGEAAGDAAGEAGDAAGTAAPGALAIYPFGGPPFHPFQSWALRSGRFWTSPVGFLVHQARGLMVSFRGALALPAPAPGAPPAVSPCTACPAPCRDACPPRALTPSGYDVPACHAWLDRPEGRDCAGAGCLVRRACPIGAGRRSAAQARFHMEAFHPCPCA